MGRHKARRGIQEIKAMEKMTSTLYITDLDGTLLNADSEVSDASKEMINKAIDCGVLFSIATARTPSTVSKIMRGVESNLPYIVMTGAAFWNPADGEFSDTVTFTIQEAEQIFEIFLRHSFPVFIYCFHDGIIQVYHSGPLSPLEREFMKGRESRYKHFHVPEDGESVIPSPLPPVLLFYSIQPTELGGPVYEEINAKCHCNPLFYHDIFGNEIAVLEAFAPGATKARAIERLKRLTGADRVVAFGDNVNDIPMLRAADMAVAVENAIPEVKEIADIVIGSNTTDSVARFILTDSQLTTHEI